MEKFENKKIIPLESENREGEEEERLEVLRDEIREIRSKILKAIEEGEELEGIGRHMIIFAQEVGDDDIDRIPAEELLLLDEIRDTAEMTDEKYEKFAKRIGQILAESAKENEGQTTKDNYQKLTGSLKPLIAEELTKRHVEFIKAEKQKRTAA